MDGFDSRRPVRVRFAETDAQGIAHHANYLSGSRSPGSSSSSASPGGYQRLRDEGIESLVLEAHVALPRPRAVFDDRLLVHARCVDVRGARFRFEYVDRARRTRDRRRLDGARTVDARTLRADAHAGLAPGRDQQDRSRPGQGSAELAQPRGGVVAGRRGGLRRVGLRPGGLRCARPDEHDLGDGAVVRVPGRVGEQLAVGGVDPARAPRSRSAASRASITTRSPGASAASSRGAIGIAPVAVSGAVCVTTRRCCGVP